MALVVALLVVYGRGVDGPFIWDDVAIVEDSHIVAPQRWQDWFISENESPFSGRPISMASMVANYALSGDSPHTYHAFSIALHVACAGLAGFVVFQTLVFSRGSPPLVENRRHAGWLTCLLVSLWALHPLQTETVQYVTQRTELLVSMFALATLACAIQGWRAEHGRVRWHVLAVIMCVLGVGSKENIVATPLLVLAWDYVFNGRREQSLLKASPWLYAGLAGVYGLLALVVLSDPRGQSTGFDHGVSALDYLRTQAEVIAHYLRLLVAPYPQVLGYDWPIRENWTWHVWPAVPLAIGVVAAGWGLVRRKAWSLPLLGFYLLLAPTSSVMPIVTEVAAERRMYMPSLMLIALAVVAAYLKLWRPLEEAGGDSGLRARRWALAGIGVMALVPLTVLSALRVEQYRDPVVLWRHDVTHLPGNTLAYEHLGVALEEAGRIDEAIATYEHAISLDQTEALANVRINLSLQLGRRGELQRSLLLAQQATATEPPSSKAYNAVGVAYIRMNQPGMAVAALARALELEADSYSARTNMGMALLMLGRLEEAINELERARAQRPDNVRARIALGKAYATADRLADAVATYESLLEQDPNQAEVHSGLGVTLARMGRYDAARRHFEKTLELQPGHPDALANLQRLNQIGQ